MLHCLEAVHREGYVHRDVKPSNFVFGVDRWCGSTPTAHPRRRRHCCALLVVSGFCKLFCGLPCDSCAAQWPLLAPYRRLRAVSCVPAHGRKRLVSYCGRCVGAASAKVIPPLPFLVPFLEYHQRYPSRLTRMNWLPGAGMPPPPSLAARPTAEFRGTSLYASPNAHDNKVRNRVGVLFYFSVTPLIALESALFFSVSTRAATPCCMWCLPLLVFFLLLLRTSVAGTTCGPFCSSSLTWRSKACPGGTTVVIGTSAQR
jgi:serine/threonine protein kinase